MQLDTLAAFLCHGRLAVLRCSLHTCARKQRPCAERGSKAQRGLLRVRHRTQPQLGLSCSTAKILHVRLCMCCVLTRGFLYVLWLLWSFGILFALMLNPSSRSRVGQPAAISQESLSDFWHVKKQGERGSSPACAAKMMQRHLYAFSRFIFDHCPALAMVWVGVSLKILRC